ncbi:MAG: Na(+)/H(+) antiporter subunit B [Alphaproteobacteria bacterium]
MTATFALDILLCLGMLGFAVAALISKAEQDAVAAFIGLSTLAAVAWARLGAPDVAMAEAAIGAGLTGALLLRHLTFNA